MSETTGWIVGLGIITMALFPFALPGIALTVVAVLPLLLIAVPVALLVAVVVAPILAVRGLRRRTETRRAGAVEGGPAATRSGWAAPPPAGLPR